MNAAAAADHRSGVQVSTSPSGCCAMLNYTDAITALAHDIVRRVEPLAHIDLSRTLVFGRFGRTRASGAYATCHALNMPTSEAGYFFWKDPLSGQVVKRSEWFATCSPTVEVDGRRIDYLFSYCLPRFCDQTLTKALKRDRYPHEPEWVAKLDTIVHELYHVDPLAPGLRQVTTADGQPAVRHHSPEFFAHVSHCVQAYLASRPDPALLDFLACDFDQLSRRYGGVTATTFMNFPSYPQRFHVPVSPQPPWPEAHIEPLPAPPLKTRYTRADLTTRVFTAGATQRVLVPAPRLAGAA